MQPRRYKVIKTLACEVAPKSGDSRANISDLVALATRMHCGWKSFTKANGRLLKNMHKAAKRFISSLC